MAAAAGTSKPLRQLPRYVPLCHLLLVVVAALLLTGGVVGGAGECSPPAARVFLLRTEQRLQGLRGSSGHGAPGAGDGSPPAGADGRRMLIGSRAPTCTYNECRGCRHRCSVQEVPIDASDPVNSAYHYKCICHL
ncbi:hypothetical protein C2845_PM13G23200 [Panicum miliaceum]|uniref:Stomagen C-terminal domain-containing protein n=1 Tax=Panicum miliaceum TaxID=4540 RepID=A0A3L6RH49_PANMI|nr:hypothetical protein C2845_PM13G23200 [Panicum miliaceum]